MLFYKFQKPGNLEFSMLRRGEVYFASAAELNDASECRPRFILKGSEELWQRLAQFVFDRVCFCSGYFEHDKDTEIRQVLGLSSAVGQRLKKKARNRDVGIENLCGAFLEALKHCGTEKLPPALLQIVGRMARSFIEEGLPRVLLDEKYIASFALNATNPTMWGHYADAERGFIRVFGTDDGKVNVRSDINILRGTRSKEGGFTEIGSYKDERLELKHVQYGRKIPKVNAFHRLIHHFSYTEEEDHYDVPLMIGGDAEEKKEHMIGLIKYSDWRNEKEVRAFFPAFEPLPPDVRVLRISSENMKGLVFGPKMSQEHKARAVTCCHIIKQACRAAGSEECEFAFFQAQHTADSFDFAIRPVGILDGQYFGRYLPLKPVRELDETTVARLRTTADLIAGREQPSS
jgi:hypothetical protein